MGKEKAWLWFAIVTAVFWGIWGAFIEIPTKAGFPATLGYITWAFTMIPCAMAAMHFASWKLEHDIRSIMLGLAVGVTGAAGQLLLFLALREGPAYIVFPFVSLFPVVTIFLSVTFLKERVSLRGWLGIILALTAIFLFSYQTPSGETFVNFGWLFFSSLVFMLWGVQGFVLKFANHVARAESIFFYMMLSSIMLIPFAWYLTDFSLEINWGFKGPYLAALIHVLNSIGALTLVYAMRYGKAIVVIPLTGLSPMITVSISLFLYGIIPTPLLTSGIILSMIAIYLLSD
jgi:uncharacterized membrane protein